MTFRARIVRLCLAGALSLAGIATYCQSLRVHECGGPIAFAGGAFVGVGLLEIVRAIFAPRAETGGIEA